MGDNVNLYLKKVCIFLISLEKLTSEQSKRKEFCVMKNKKNRENSGSKQETQSENE